MKRQEVIANLKGVFPPVVTPFSHRGEVDKVCFRNNLERYADAGLGGVVVGGSTGEACYLTERERLSLVEVARKVMRPSELLIAGTGLESTRDTLRLSREAQARGADAVLLLPPAYYKARMDSATLLAHFRAIADGLRRPIVLYSIPQFTGFRMEADTIAKLSRHPNIVGVKESSGDLRFLQAIRKKAKPGFRVLSGSALIFLKALRAGASGGVLGQAGFAPELCVAVYEAFRRGQMKIARQFEKKLVRLAHQISAPYGVQGIKVALDLCGYAGGQPRAPLLPLNGSARRAIAKALDEVRAGLEF